MVKSRFKGGIHTVEKLSILQSYLKFYATALKNQGFSLIYIDAFAGTGDYALDLGDAGLFAGLGEEEGMVSRPGSAKLALSIEPQFSELIFIDNQLSSVASLQSIKSQNPSRSIKIVSGDANESVMKICADTPWQNRVRGVLFLDPFNMAVHWETLEAIGRTQALDLWYLFPT
ncbi:three-Cys-motif partner protein TcmP, partial [Rhodoplanes sp. SY1]|uniref:three-Cys-motif partner protein TcmP n=1 Tax=Rhodoplanes sp. SY1 TaxID=3166646 RepID=UPI0038B59FB7